MNNYIKYARKNDWMPDWAWYQINDKSAMENYMEQKEKMIESITEAADQTAPQFIFTSEVKIK